MPKPMRWKKDITADLTREAAAQCAAGNHKFGGWRLIGDGPAYWDCLHGCGHRQIHNA